MAERQISGEAPVTRSKSADGARVDPARADRVRSKSGDVTRFEKLSARDKASKPEALDPRHHREHKTKIYPGKNQLNPNSGGWGCCTPSRAQTDLVLDGAEVADEIYSAEEEQTRELKIIMGKQHKDTMNEVTKICAGQNGNLETAMASVQKQLQSLHEKLEETSQKTVQSVFDLSDTVVKRLDEGGGFAGKRSRPIVAGKINQMEGGSSRIPGGIPGGNVIESVKAEVVVGSVVDSPDFDTENERQTSSATDAGEAAEEGDTSFAVTGSLEFPESPDSSKKKGKKKGQRDLADDKLKGLRKSKKLKLERDDDDTTLFLVAEKGELQDLVDQEMKTLAYRFKLSEEFMERLIPTDGKITKLVHSRPFGITVNVMIFINVLVIAVEAENAISRAREGLEPSLIFLFSDLAFCCFFTTEIVLRISGDRILFFIGADSKWNIMDASFVGMDIMNQVFLLALQGVDISFMSSFRTGVKMIRLCRTARALRMFRIVRNSTRARLLFEETIACASMGFWLICVLSVALVFFGLFFMQASADVLLGEDYSHELQNRVLSIFATGPEAVFSLFELAAGGEPWSATFKTLMEVDSMYGILFVLFVFFIMILFMNVVTGVFVDSALKRAKRHEVENKYDEAEMFKCMLKKAELMNVDSLVSKTEFLEFLKTPYGTDQLTALGLETAEALGIYELLDKDGKHNVNIDVLAGGCARFTQPVRSADSVAMHLAMKKITKEQRMFAKFVQERFNAMVTMMEFLMNGE